MDREKVIKGLEICSEHGSWHGLDCEHNEAYKDCPYRGCKTGCIVTIAKDAIALLKEQEPVKVQYTAMGGLRYGACPQCTARIDNLVNPKACGFCGQAVKWE